MLDTIERYIKGEMLPEEGFFWTAAQIKPGCRPNGCGTYDFLNQMNKFGTQATAAWTGRNPQQIIQEGAIRRDKTKWWGSGKIPKGCCGSSFHCRDHCNHQQPDITYSPKADNNM
jgi:hypothetical protein